jgi:cell division protein FtsL
LLFVLVIIYISNGLIYDLEIRKQNRLEEQLLKVRTRYNVKLNEFNEFHSYQNIIDLVNKYGLNLEEPSNPPLKVEK